jgi:hypothetical protein
MPNLTPVQLKRALVDAGLIIFRTLAEEVLVAERVRENLIMDSGVRLKSVASAPKLEVRVVFRAQRGAFPGETEAALFARVRTLAEPAVARGFREVAAETSHVKDPGDNTKTLDVFYELVLSRDADDLPAALDDVRFALSLDRVAHAGK